MDRRRFLAATTGAITGLAGCGGSPSQQGGTTPTDGPGTGAESATDTDGRPAAVGLDTLATGLGTPIDLAVAPDADRLYVAEQQGAVRVHEGGELRSDPLLDLRDAVVTGYEQGVLGLALHPDFATNRRLFVRYSAPPREGTPSGYSHTFVLAEFEVTEDGRSVRADSERTVLEIPQPQANHNAGAIVFGSEGYLYVAVGDGGSGNDQGRGHVDDWYDAVDGGNGQDVTENLLGSVLRIDVNSETSEHPRSDEDAPASPEDDEGYAVPEDNPLVGRDGLAEQYAWGFRNPWRLAVDGERLFAGDVGQGAYEEVDVVRKGGNYGWNVKEGTHCFGDVDDCPDETPASVRGGEPLVDPVVEYPHRGQPVSGVSVIAGNVYRGNALPGLDGRFVFGDYRAGGELFVADPAESGLWSTAVLPVADADAGKLGELYAFERADGELYVLGSGTDGGGLHRLAPAEG